MKAVMIKDKEKCKKLVKEYVIKVSQKLAAPVINESLSTAANIGNNLSAQSKSILLESMQQLNSKS